VFTLVASLFFYFLTRPGHHLCKDFQATWGDWWCKRHFALDEMCFNWFWLNFSFVVHVSVLATLLSIQLVGVIWYYVIAVHIFEACGLGNCFTELCIYCNTGSWL